MNPVVQTYTGKSAVDRENAIESKMASAEVERKASVKVEWIQDAIDRRANCVGPVLEGILHDIEGRSHWGLNE